jgi:thiosulfate dehydrogenase
MLKGLIIGIVLGVLLLIGGVYFYFSTGQAPVATASTPMPFEKQLAHKALEATLEKTKKEDPAVPADEPNFLAGADVYKQNCAVCHGLPGEAPTAIAEGMFPKPPQLFHGTGVTDDPAWESYWKAENGIRLTGMPGFKGKLTNTQLWQVSQLLANADKISPAVKNSLTNGATLPPAPVPASGTALKK